MQKLLLAIICSDEQFSFASLPMIIMDLLHNYCRLSQVFFSRLVTPIYGFYFSQWELELPSKKILQATRSKLCESSLRSMIMISIWHYDHITKQISISLSACEVWQGCHAIWKTERTEKNQGIWKLAGKVREFEKWPKKQGKVREFHSPIWVATLIFCCKYINNFKFV